MLTSNRGGGNVAKTEWAAFQITPPSPFFQCGLLLILDESRIGRQERGDHDPEGSEQRAEDESKTTICAFVVGNCPGDCCAKQPAANSEKEKQFRHVTLRFLNHPDPLAPSCHATVVRCRDTYKCAIPWVRGQLQDPACSAYRRRADFGRFASYSVFDSAATGKATLLAYSASKVRMMSG